MATISVKMLGSVLVERLVCVRTQELVNSQIRSWSFDGSIRKLPLSALCRSAAVRRIQLPAVSQLWSMVEVQSIVREMGVLLVWAILVDIPLKAKGGTR